MKTDSGQTRSRPTNAFGAALKSRLTRLPRNRRVDGRTHSARRRKAIIAKFVTELGGPVAVGDVAMLRVERAAELLVASELMRAKALRGEAIDPLALVRLEGVASRSRL